MAGRLRTVTIIEDPLKRLGTLVSAARMAVRDEKGKPLSRASAARQMPIARQILINIEAGKPLKSSTAEVPRSASDESYTVIEEFFEWEPGSIMRYLRESGPEPGPAEVRREDVPDALGDESLGDMGMPELLGKMVAQWYRSAPTGRRRHARNLLVDFIEAHPHGGDTGD